MHSPWVNGSPRFTIFRANEKLRVAILFYDFIQFANVHSVCCKLPSSSSTVFLPCITCQKVFLFQTCRMLLQNFSLCFISPLQQFLIANDKKVISPEYHKNTRACDSRTVVMIITNVLCVYTYTWQPQ